MKKYIKNNIKTLIAFIIGITVSGVVVYAATVASADVTYSISISSAYGATKTNVQAALDELYSKANGLSTYKQTLIRLCGGGTPGTPTSFATDSWVTICYAARTGNTTAYAPKSGGPSAQATRTVNMGSLGTHTLRVANTTPCTSQSSTTGCGFVIEFADIITTKYMNSTNSNIRGYPSSSMYTYINNTVLQAMPTEIRNIMIPTTVISSHGTGDSNNFMTANQYLYLLDRQEVFGDNSSENTAYSATRQLDYYSLNNNNNSRKKGNDWWLRTTDSNMPNYIYVYSSGSIGTYMASAIFGVSPAFRIG